MDNSTHLKLQFQSTTWHLYRAVQYSELLNTLAAECTTVVLSEEEPVPDSGVRISPHEVDYSTIHWVCMLLEDPNTMLAVPTSVLLEDQLVHAISYLALNQGGLNQMFSWCSSRWTSTRSVTELGVIFNVVQLFNGTSVNLPRMPNGEVGFDHFDVEKVLLTGQKLKPRDTSALRHITGAYANSASVLVPQEWTPDATSFLEQLVGPLYRKLLNRNREWVVGGAGIFKCIRAAATGTRPLYDPATVCFYFFDETAMYCAVRCALRLGYSTGLRDDLYCCTLRGRTVALRMSPAKSTRSLLLWERVYQCLYSPAEGALVSVNILPSILGFHVPPVLETWSWDASATYLLQVVMRAKYFIQANYLDYNWKLPNIQSQPPVHIIPFTRVLLCARFLDALELRVQLSKDAALEVGLSHHHQVVDVRVPHGILNNSPLSYGDFVQLRVLSAGLGVVHGMHYGTRPLLQAVDIQVWVN